MVEHATAETESTFQPVTVQRAGQRVAAARGLFQRVLGAWASDCLELRRRGMLSERQGVEAADVTQPLQQAA